MKRVVATMLLTAGLFYIGGVALSQPAPKQESKVKVVTLSGNTVGGVWVQTPSGQIVTIYGDGKTGMTVLGFYKDADKTSMCDFAIGCDKNGCSFQVIDPKTKKPVSIPVEALLKLVENK